MTKKILVVDCPEGWMYGFPKPAPTEKMTPNEKIKWFITNGYPQELVDQGMLKYTRYYETEVDDE